MDEGNVVPVKNFTSVGERFGGFAVSHITASLLLCFPSVIFYSALFEPLFSFVSWLVPAFLMGLYFPLGMLAAWMEDWRSPQTRRDRVLAIFLPAMAAWTWVGIVLLVCFVGQSGEAFIIVFALSMLLACPSSLFVLFCVPWLSGPLSLGFLGLISGFLPPLLFAFGSFFQAKRKNRG